MPVANYSAAFPAQGISEQPVGLDREAALAANSLVITEAVLVANLVTWSILKHLAESPSGFKTRISADFAVSAAKLSTPPPPNEI